MLLEEQSNQDRHFLHLCFHLLVVVLYSKTLLLGFRVIKINILKMSENLGKIYPSVLRKHALEKLCQFILSINI